MRLCYCMMPLHERDFQDESQLNRLICCYTAHICPKCSLHAAILCVCAEKDKERTQRHHDELVIAINAGKDELREKRKERGAAADSNRKAGYNTSEHHAAALVPGLSYQLHKHKHLQAQNAKLPSVGKLLQCLEMQ